MANFEFRGKRFFLTYSQCPISKEDISKELLERFAKELKNVEKWIVCREFHQDGNVHSHVYIELADTFRAKMPSTWLDIQGHHPNVTQVRSYRATINYITKDNDYISNFDVKVPNISKKDLGKKLIQGESLVDLVGKNPELLIGYKRIKEDLSVFLQDQKKPKALDGVCGIWIAGPAGVGKSTIATTKFGDYYFKDKSKWWDGHNGERTAVCEDVGSDWRDIIPYFKIWADRYPFRAEIKSSTIFIRPERLVVTSNFTIEELFEKMKWDKDDYAPYLRRFKQFYIRSIEDYDNQVE